MVDKQETGSALVTRSSYTVVIPTKDRPGMLREALDSVFSQTLPPESVQVVVDEVEDRVKYSFLARFDARLSVRFTGGGLGGAKARNLGLDCVKTPYTFFLDDDDLWLPRKAEKQIEMLRAHPEWVAITCWRTEEGGEKSREVRVSPWWLRTFCRAENVVGSLSQFGMRWDGGMRNLRLEPELPSSQDQELYLQVCNYGVIGLVEEVLVRYRQHPGDRITGSDRGKGNTLEKVYKKHKLSLSRGEDFFWRARLCSWRMLDGGSYQYRVRQMIFILSCLIRSGKLIIGAQHIVRRALVGLFRRTE